MKTLLKILAVCALIILAGYAACSILYPTIDIRYRLTLDVDVDGVRHIGSGVVEIEFNTSAAALRWAITGGAQSLSGFMRGNAITVDLGDRGLLLVVNDLPCNTYNNGHPDPAFFDARNLSELPLSSYSYGANPKPQGNTFLREAQHYTTPVDLPPVRLPLLLRVHDLPDHTSVEAVDPRDLAQAFGPGVKLVKATYQVTSDPITPMPGSWPSFLTQGPNDPKRLDMTGVPWGCYVSDTMFKGLLQ